MRIGLCTFWKSVNYGATLQALALASYLRKLDIDVWMVDCCQPMSFDATMSGPTGYFGFRNRRNPLRGYVMGTLRLILEIGGWGSFRRFSRSRSFFRRFFRPFRSVAYATSEEFAAKCEFPLLVVGSDQLWSPHTVSWIDGYLLERIPAVVKRISFGTGVSCDTLVVKGVDYSERYHKALSMFSAISVRECTLIPQLKELSGKDVFWSIDPTLLHNSGDWDKILHLERDKKVNRHITVYWLSSLIPYLSEFIAFAQAQKCEVHLFTEFNTFQLKPGASKREYLQYLKMRIRLSKCKRVRLYKSATPDEFIWDLSTSEGVITDSFHALMFATIYKRNIKVVIPEERASMRSRMLDFLQKVGWDNVIVDHITKDMMVVGADTVSGQRSKLESWIAISKDWLSDALMKCQCGTPIRSVSTVQS